MRRTLYPMPNAHPPGPRDMPRPGQSAGHRPQECHLVRKALTEPPLA
jgi:hypothetical protein